MNEVLIYGFIVGYMVGGTSLVANAIEKDVKSGALIRFVGASFGLSMVGVLFAGAAGIGHMIWESLK